MCRARDRDGPGACIACVVAKANRPCQVVPSAMDCGPSNSYAEALILNVTAFGSGASGGEYLDEV